MRQAGSIVRLPLVKKASEGRIKRFHDLRHFYASMLIAQGENPKYIQDHYVRYGGPKPPQLDHDGIDDGFDGKASVVRYWYGGRWLQLQGAD